MIMDNKVKILVSFGTRPEGIKLAPVIKCIEKQKSRIDLSICSTGQHKEMLQQVINFFEIKTDFSLNLMTENQTLSSFSSKLINKIDSIFNSINPEIILIQGDTSTAFLTALIAFYKKIKIGHVEAGLRTYDKYNPFPEEINRQLISKVSDFHFAPTKKAQNNLIAEGISTESIFLVGNTIVDAIKWGINKIKMKKDKVMSNEIFQKISNDKKIILVTMHRRESFGEDIKNVCYALKSIASNYKDIQIVYPVHLNPNVRKPVFEILSKEDNIILTDPLDYELFIWLMYNSYFIVTDSGGVQEEAPTLKKPVLVIRKKTERTESIDLCLSKIIGTKKESIINNISKLIKNKNIYDKMIASSNPYGDGKASDKIVDIIYKKLRD